MKDNTRIILFTALLAVICALLLAGSTLLTAPYRQANEKAEEVRNFLEVLGAPLQGASDSRELLALFNREVRVKTLGPLTIYEYFPESGSRDRPAAVAVPFMGMGLWGPIKGVLALEPDLRTIKGISFYQQEETPGLGGEIASGWFRRQFENKRILSPEGKAEFRVLKPGAQAGPTAVDGITGATMTSQRVGLMLDELARSIAEERGAYVQ
jgi:Na+-transporting NADH:ubiquinone oxidoreductase subunit C